MKKLALLLTFVIAGFAPNFISAQTVQCQPTGSYAAWCPLNASVQLFTTVAATGTQTATATKVYNFNVNGNLLMTWAGITGSPLTCTVQVKTGDSLGNLINNGSAVSVTPTNGTVSVQFTPATAQQTADEVNVTFACGTYPTAGTLSLEFVPQTSLIAPSNYGTSPGAVPAIAANAYITNTPSVTGSGVFEVGPTTSANTTGNPFFVTGAGTAGSAATNPITIQGIASMTPVETSPTTAANTATNPFYNALTDATNAMGAMSNFGTSPGAVKSLNVNASLYSGTTVLGTPNTFGTTAPTGAALGANVSLFIGTTLAANSGAGIQKVGIGGNAAGAAMDSTIGAATAPTNALATSNVYDTTAPAPTNGQAMAVQSDQAGNHLIFPGVQFKAGTGWTSATSLNTLQYATGTATVGQLIGVAALLVQLDQTTTLTGGAVTFQCTYDNSNWVSLPVAQVVNPNTLVALTNPYTFVASTNVPFLLLLQGCLNVRANLTTVITGSGTVTPEWTTLSVPNVNVITGAGTAGTPQGGVVSVQGVTSGTPIPTSSGAVSPVQIAAVSGTSQINNKVSAAAATTLTNAFPGTTTKGNSILCVGFEGAITGSVVPVFTDGQSNTYISVESGAAAAPGYAVSIATNIVGGTTDTVTLTTVSGSASFSCYELTGAVQVGQVWDYAQNLQATASTLNFNQVSSAIPNELVVVGVGMGAGTINATPGLAGGPSNITTVDQSNTAPLSGGSTPALSVFYSAHTNTNNVPTFTQSLSLSASETYSAILVSVKPASISLIGNVPDPCQQGAGTPGNINLTAGGTLITGSAGKQVYICTLDIITASAQNIALVEGTGTVCATNTAGMAGGTTAATGWNFSANGGLVKGIGGFWVYKTATSGDNVCLLLSGSGQTSGGYRYIIE